MIVIEDMMGDLGKERITLREDIMEDRKIQAEMADAADKAWTPQPKGRQPQRWLGHPAGRRGLGKILTCRIS